MPLPLHDRTLADTESQALADSSSTRLDESTQSLSANDQQGQEQEQAAGGQTTSGQAQMSEQDKKDADTLYEERIEEEYAKREGGA
ncbi:hypothetical protein MMC10_004871 [Thelotrema lepadinum]|nr:hypothetical protein [Thelotrema lepadinum]